MTNLIPSALNLIAHSVAQTAEGPGLPGAPAAAPAAGTPGAAAPGASNAAPGGSSFMIMMIVLLGAMILFSFVSSRREKKKRDQLLGNIKKHDKVLTIGGVVGTGPTAHGGWPGLVPGVSVRLPPSAAGPRQVSVRVRPRRPMAVASVAAWLRRWCE